MLLSEDKKKDFIALHCNCHKSPCRETPFMKIRDVNSYSSGGVSHENAMVYKVASRINHACFPNTSGMFTKAGNIVISSTEDIKKGEELTIDYIGTNSIPISPRRVFLQRQYRFHCYYRGCVGNKVLSMNDALQGMQS
jgi:hypothetical protein